MIEVLMLLGGRKGSYDLKKNRNWWWGEKKAKKIDRL